MQDITSRVILKFGLPCDRQTEAENSKRFHETLGIYVPHAGSMRRAQAGLSLICLSGQMKTHSPQSH